MSQNHPLSQALSLVKLNYVLQSQGFQNRFGIFPGFRMPRMKYIRFGPIYISKIIYSPQGARKSEHATGKSEHATGKSEHATGKSEQVARKSEPAPRKSEPVPRKIEQSA